MNPSPYRVLGVRRRSEEEEEGGGPALVNTGSPSMVDAGGGGGYEGVTTPTLVAVVVTPDEHPSGDPLPEDGGGASPGSSGGGVASPDEEGNISIGRVSAISSEVDPHTLPALSPPPLQEAAVQIATTLAEDALEARMKTEQRNLEGVDGILSSMKEQDEPRDSRLVGDENEITAPVSSNGI